MVNEKKLHVRLRDQACTDLIPINIFLKPSKCMFPSTSCILSLILMANQCTTMYFLEDFKNTLFNQIPVGAVSNTTAEKSILLTSFITSA